MIIAVVGCIDDESTLPIRGNGKTTVTTFYALREYQMNKRNIVSNYHLQNVPYDYMNSQQIYESFMSETLPGEPIILFDEIQAFLNSMGSSPKVITKFVNGFIGQIRKLDADVFCTNQRFVDVAKRFRSQVDSILIPIKIHADGNVCMKDNCRLHHFIEIHSYKPYREFPLSIIDTQYVGKYFNTKEIIRDELNI